jgi:hypothetical protein
MFTIENGAISQPTASHNLGVALEEIAQRTKTIYEDAKRGAPVSAATFAHIEATERLIKLLQPRDIGGETSGIAVSIMGVDVYVHDQGERYAVSVNADEAGKPAVVESFDGTSWEQPLP